MKKKVLIVLVIIIVYTCGLIGLKLTGIFKNDSANYQEKESLEGKEPLEENEDKYFSVYIGSPHYRDLYSLIESTPDSSVYSSTIVYANDMKAEQIFYNTLVFIYKYGHNYVKTGKINSISDGEITASYVTFTDVLDAAKKLYYIEYNRKLDDEKPDVLFSKYSQTAEMILGQVGDEDVYYYQCSSDNSDWGGDCSYINEHPRLTDVIFSGAITREDAIILYDKTILNMDIDMADTEIGTISKYDKTGKIFIDDKFKCNGSLINCLYNKYPEYFTVYRHEFKKIADGNNTYFQYEYSIPMPQDSFETANIGKLKVKVPSYFNWCEVTADRNQWACWGYNGDGMLVISREETKTDIKEILKNHIDVFGSINSVDDLDIKNVTINGVEWIYASLNYDLQYIRYVYVTKHGKETYVLEADYNTDNDYNKNDTKRIIESLKFVS